MSVAIIADMLGHAGHTHVINLLVLTFIITNVTSEEWGIRKIVIHIKFCY